MHSLFSYQDAVTFDTGSVRGTGEIINIFTTSDMVRYLIQVITSSNGIVSEQYIVNQNNLKKVAS